MLRGACLNIVFHVGPSPLEGRIFFFPVASSAGRDSTSRAYGNSSMPLALLPEEGKGSGRSFRDPVLLKVCKTFGLMAGCCSACMLAVLMLTALSDGLTKGPGMEYNHATVMYLCESSSSYQASISRIEKLWQWSPSPVQWSASS